LGNRPKAFPEARRKVGGGGKWRGAILPRGKGDVEEKTVNF